jgi:hypothetical protein
MPVREEDIPARLTLVGTEKPLSFSVAHIFCGAAESLERFGCAYYILIYTEDFVALGTLVPTNNLPDRAFKGRGF